MARVVMVMGYPAAGKSSVAKPYEEQGFVYLNRDKAGGKVIDLVPQMTAALRAGKDVVLDNTFPTVASRKPFIDAAQAQDVVIVCDWVASTIEDAQFNACVRMMERFGRILDPAEIKRDASPNIFPPGVLFRYRKEFEPPTTDEGFKRVDKRPFVRDVPKTWVNRAVILDYDGTLRDTKTGEKWPLYPGDIQILPKRAQVLKKWQKQGFLLLGVSNQSGIAKNNPPEKVAIECFEATNKKLGLDIPYLFCPHNPAPISCYCRKPMPGFGVHFIVQHKLNPAECVMVGDQTTDKTFATRCGFKFTHADVFFK
jgi:HAD superfamily hydrolase (TIGR01662 family)